MSGYASTAKSSKHNISVSSRTISIKPKAMASAIINLSDRERANFTALKANLSIGNTERVGIGIMSATNRKFLPK